MVKYPQVIEYCEQREIRWEDGVEEIYLLKKRQMNGAHAELFSYALHQELTTATAREELAPLQLQAYESVSMTKPERHVLLSFDRPMCRARFAIESANGQFRINVNRAELGNLPHEH